jgi:hypothetical protein
MPKIKNTNAASTHICMVGRGGVVGIFIFFFFGVLSVMNRKFQ